MPAVVRRREAEVASRNSLWNLTSIQHEFLD